MVRWNSLGAVVKNRSSQKLVIAFDHPTQDNTWAYSYLSGGQRSPGGLDVDGFRAFDTSVVVIYSALWSDTMHTSWWKLRNGHIAVVKDGSRPNELIFDVYTDVAFGQVTVWMSPQMKTDRDFGWKFGNETLPIAAENL
ncbi:MAG: hypothetical protein KDA89_22560 [Planctomycetaceae bacterium]|nr:hypothetical protein [Planctomycetaceae bacterium]